MNFSRLDAFWVVNWSIDDGGLCDYIDPHWREFTGQAADAARGDGWLETIHPDDRNHVKAELNDARRSERSFQLTARIRRADQQFRWAMAFGAPRRDEQGAFSGFRGSFIDFHDRTIAEQELAEAWLRQRAAFASLGEAVFIADAEGRPTDFNDEFIRYHRFKDRSECSRSIADCTQYLDVWFPDGRLAPLEQWAIPRALRGETASNVEFRLARKGTGETWWGSYNFSPVQDETGKIIGAVVAVREISALKEAEKRLREKEALFQAVVDGSPDAIFLKDREGRMLLANPVTLAAIGKPAEFCIGKTDAEFLLNPDDARAIMANDRRIMESGRTEIYDETLMTPFGKRCFRNNKTPYRDAAGKVIGLIGSARDITEQEAAVAALRESEERFRVLTQAIPSFLWETDAEGFNTFMSDAWCSYTGRTAAESAGRGWAEALHPDDRERTYGYWRAAVASPKLFECRYRLRAADGSYRWFLTRAAPLLDSDGGVRRWVGSSTDIDEIVQAQAALAAADRRKDEFLATLAHELRNPLSPIRNAVHVLKKKQTSENSDAALLAMVDRQVDHLVRLVDELLEISRINRGLIELRKESVAVSDFLQHALETCQPLIEKNGHRLSVKLEDEPLWVFGDPLRLSQVAANLIDNAAKYTPPGGRIEIRAAREGDELALRVRDNGVGVSAEMMPQIFNLFVRAEGQARLSRGGLGIGLALARQFVLLHGGRLEANSDGAGKGSEFIIRLPLHRNPVVVAEPNERDATDDVQTARVLVIDDDHDVADSFALLLETLGATVRTAYDGPAGVGAVAAFEPDLIFVDIGMPGVDGYETARRIRSHPRERRFLLVALSGWGQKEDRLRAQEAGFDLHLTKPAPIDALKNLLARLRPPAGAAGHAR